MKKIFTFVLVVCSLLLATSVSAANIVFNENFNDGELTGFDNVEFSLTKIVEEDSNKYIQGTTQKNPVNERFEITLKEGVANDFMVVSTDFKAVLPESDQLMLIGMDDNNSWQRTQQLYNLVEDTKWHKLTVISDFANRTTIVAVDGKVTINTNWDKNCAWKPTNEGAKFRIEGYCVNFDNTVIITDNCDDYFGISDILLNDASLDNKNGNFGQIGSDLSKISVRIDFPVADTEVLPIVVKHGEKEIGAESLYNTETGYFDVTLTEALEPGEPYTIETSEEITLLLDAKLKAVTYSFTTAKNTFEFSDMVITSEDGTIAKIDIRNNKFTPNSATVVIFVYDSEGMMVDCAAGETVEIKPMKSEPVKAELDTVYTDDYTIEAYVWDNVISALPLLSVN